MLGNRNFRNLLLIILAIGVFTILVLEFFPHLSDTDTPSQHNFIRGIFLVVLLLFIGGTFFRRGISANRITEGIKRVLLWILIFSVLIVGYAFRHELDFIKKRVISVLIPSYSFIEDGELILSRYADGHFYLTATANEHVRIKFLVDTGATGVAITRQDAINMGFDPEKLHYTQRSSTASGVAYSAPIKIKKLQIGKKVIYNVSASVSSGGLDISLLGMSVLDDFSDFRFVNDNLILSY